MNRVDAVVGMLGGPAVLGTQVSTPAELRRLLREGLPYAVLETVTRALNVNLTSLSRFMAISERTLARRKQTRQPLRPDESDRIYRLARTFTRAEEVLGEPAKAARWFSRPNRALGGESPLSLLDTEAGAQEVEAVLGRIEDGVYS